MVCFASVPSEDEDDDGFRYEAFLANAQPYHAPTVKIKTLVTCRLEKYRGLTEAWLAKHGIEYDELIMMDYPDKAAQKKAGRHSTYKADVYKESGAMLFIESSLYQAKRIASESGKEVFCVDTMQMIYPDVTPRQRFEAVLEDRNRHSYLTARPAVNLQPLAFPGSLGTTKRSTTMDKEVALELAADEEVEVEAIQHLLAEIERANEQMAEDQQEINELKTQTREILKKLKAA